MTAENRGRFDPRRKFRSATKKLKLSHGAKRLSRNLSFRLLDWRARARRPRLGHVTFVGVTGSCGKTTTTALVKEILAGRDICQAWFNEPAGAHHSIRVRQAILSVCPETRYYVYETTSSGPGSIGRQLDLLSPRIGVVTTVGADHRSAFRSLEATAKEKATLVERLPPDGAAILNIDDPYVAAMAARTKAPVVTYGISPEADVRGSGVACQWPDRLTFNVSHGSEEARVVTRFVGEHWAISVLAAIACGIACGLDLKTCARAVAGVAPVFGRYSVHASEGGASFVLDSIKAPFWTIPAGLKFVAAASAPRKTIVFGTISDYAGNAGRVYRRVAREALATADRVWPTDNGVTT
jgi:UDP-N-acetylmuramoyl-tripeptide--D-alanyl-D-alanine ligase